MIFLVGLVFGLNVCCACLGMVVVVMCHVVVCWLWCR